MIIKCPASRQIDSFQGVVGSVRLDPHTLKQVKKKKYIEEDYGMSDIDNFSVEDDYHQTIKPIQAAEDPWMLLSNRESSKLLNTSYFE